MAEFINDVKLWHKKVMDTPFRGRVHAEAKTAEDAAKLPGNAIKSIERASPAGFPKHHGVLVEYGDDCVVRGHGDMNDKFVWKGTNEEYHRTWIVD